METSIDDIEYVIYCRKSSDESTEKQVQSIPDQIKKCIEYANSNWLKIKKKPENFSDFESEREIIEENNNSEISNQRLYKETRGLFIIKEQKSGKIPFKRPKRRKLMELIDQWKIKWLLSYAPDRQARNILEWGEIINFVDEGKINLKYTNFHFEDNAAGKMMLGIWFVFSKQYSDKLSEDTKRGMSSKFESWKALWTYKHGYYFLPSWHHLPHPQFFKLRQQAFRMKIDENRSDNYITSRLTKKGYVKQIFNERWEVVKESEFKWKNMHTIRKDPFYYWLYNRKDDFVNLNELDTWYEQMISEDDHQILIERFYENQWPKARQEVKEEFYHVMPLPQDFIKTPDAYSLTFNLPNIKRFRKKLEAVQVKNPEANLWDIVKPEQIRYTCVNTKSKHKWLEMKYDSIERVIEKTISKMTISDETYKKYSDFMLQEFENKVTERNKQKRELELHKGKTEHKLNRYMANNMAIKKDEREQGIYEQEKKRLVSLIESMQADIDNLTDEWRNNILEYEAIFWILQNASDKFTKLNYVQKRKIVTLLFLNITINDDWSVDTYIRPWLEDLFEWMGRSTGIEPAARGTTNLCSTTELRPPW
jgi:DNA invertase Pin-like site-specific DNA recombinase